MHTLSVRQPDAWLLVNGIKIVENRSWSTQHRGPLLIHASARRMTATDWDYLANVCDDYGLPCPQLNDVRVGGIVGAIWIDDVADSVPVASAEDDWWDGESYAWISTHSTPCAFIPCKGRLHLWDHPTPPDIDLNRRGAK